MNKKMEHLITGEIKFEDIQKIEKDFQIILPLDYKHFLLEKNGGLPKKNTFNLNNYEEKCEIFFSIDDGITTYKHLTLEEQWTDLVKLSYLPDDLYPMGRDGGGNYICISLKGENYGKIYFYDHEVDNENDDGSLNRENLYLIANNFIEFLEKLH